MIGFIGAGIGLLGVFAGIAAIVWGTGCREYLGGKKQSKLPPAAKDSLRASIFSLNHPGSPYDIKPSTESDLAVEWKIADSEWSGILSRERLVETHRALAVFDEPRKTVRYYEETGRIQWQIGAGGQFPSANVSYQTNFFKGRILFQKSRGVQYGIKDGGVPGKIYDYKFDIGYVRDPIKNIVEEGGWEFVPVIRKEHATFQSLAPDYRQ